MNIVDELGIDVYEQKAQLFQILSHPARLQIFDVLRRGEECVCHIQSLLGKRQSYVSQQLMTLRDAGLVTDRRDGLYVFYRLSDSMVGEVLELVLGPVGHRSECEETACPCCHELEPVAPASEHAQSFQ